MEHLPKQITPVGPTEQLVRDIAMDVGKEVVAHIEYAYPQMFEAVAAKSAKLSIRNATYNAIMAAVKAADQGQAEQMMDRHDKQRRNQRQMLKRVRA